MSGSRSPLLLLGATVAERETLSALIPPRTKSHGEWLMETLAYYAEQGIAVPPIQVMIWQIPRVAVEGHA